MNNFLNSKGAKTIFFIFGLMVIATVMFFVTNQSSIVAGTAASKIVFYKDSHDFGKVPQGPKLETNFEFTNRGSSTLVIEKIQTTCGCTGATSGDKKEFAKGEKGTINVSFTTQGREGKQEKSVMVFTNDPNQPQKTLKISCNIDPKM
jgi:hypothetical protein